MALNNLSRTDLYAFLNAYNNVFNAEKLLAKDTKESEWCSKDKIQAWRLLKSALASFKTLEPKSR